MAESLRVAFGHPGGNPNSFHAALSYYERNMLESFYVPWMPSNIELALLGLLPGFSDFRARVSRRRFEALSQAPLIQGRLSEWIRMLRRILGSGEPVGLEANDWLMNVMSQGLANSRPSALHCYEDCSLMQFEAAKRFGVTSIYDMPIGYYDWWDGRRTVLCEKYSSWVTSREKYGANAEYLIRKRKEMKLADVVVTASSFARKTIAEAAHRDAIVIPYGVDCVETMPRYQGGHQVRFVFAGTCGLRKGLPLLLEVWESLSLKDAVLDLAGSWQLSPVRKQHLPKGVTYHGPVSSSKLMDLFRSSDWLVLPSNFEGFGLVILEALSQGLPVIASTATGAPDLPKSAAVVIFEAESKEGLADALKHAYKVRSAELRSEAHRVSIQCSWEKYRGNLSSAITGLLLR